MYHYDPSTALEELRDDAVLPNPVHVRDMILRTKHTPEQAMELNRRLQSYQHAFAEASKRACELLEDLRAAPLKS